MSGKVVAVAALIIAVLAGGASFFAVNRANQSAQPAVTTTATTPLKGDTGTQGLQGIQGEQGIPGTQGANGAAGSKGSTGAKGQTGAAGANGATGAQGPATQATCLNGSDCVALQGSAATAQSGSTNISGTATSDTIKTNKVYQRPSKLMIYYGIPQGVNSMWNDDFAAQAFSRWDEVVFGTGLEDPTNTYYASTKNIISKMHGLNANQKVFGYINIGVSIGNESISSLETQMSQWKASGADDIFFDLAGYDYQVPRSRLNTLLDYAHGLGLGVMVNAFVPADVMGNSVDATYNPSGTATHMNATDFYLLESWVVNTGAYSSHNGYATMSDIKTRADSAVGFRSTLGVKITTINSVDYTAYNDEQITKYFQMVQAASEIYSLDAYGLAAFNYSSQAPNSNALRYFDFDPNYASTYNINAPYTIDGPWTELTRPDTGMTFHNDFQTLTYWYSNSQTSQLKVLNIDTLNNNVGIGTVAPGAKLHVITSDNATPSLIVQAKSGQTAELLNVENSSGNSLMKVTVDGGLALNNETRGINVAVTQTATTLAVTFPTAYPSSTYAVLCTPNYSTTCYVTNQTANGFTLNFGSAAPASASVSWLAIR